MHYTYNCSFIKIVLLILIVVTIYRIKYNSWDGFLYLFCYCCNLTPLSICVQTQVQAIIASYSSRDQTFVRFVLRDIQIKLKFKHIAQIIICVHLKANRMFQARIYVRIRKSVESFLLYFNYQIFEGKLQDDLAKHIPNLKMAPNS